MIPRCIIINNTTDFLLRYRSPHAGLMVNYCFETFQKIHNRPHCHVNKRCYCLQNKFQPAVSLSSTKAESATAARAKKLALYLRYILKELGY